jgi:pyrimidine deaminase RibD-like protein
MVGALLVQDGRIVGEGFHRYDLLRHAESYAIEEAGPRAREATLYCTLEPCCHYGRTPPCTDALIAAGVSRAVIAMADPNPRVAGQGLDQLRQAGIQVEVGLLQEEAVRLNEGYLKYIKQGLPLLHAVANGEDLFGVGFGAEPERGGSKRDPLTAWLPSRELLEIVSEYDAVLVGNLPNTSRSIIDACLGRQRHRPLIIAGEREYIRDFEELAASANSSPDCRTTSGPGQGASSCRATIMELGFRQAPSGQLDPGLPPVGVGSSTNGRSTATRCGSELDSILECLGQMRATSALLLPGDKNLIDSSNVSRVDRITIVRQQVPLDEAGQSRSRHDPLAGLDSILECSLVHETSGYIEVTGRLRGANPGHKQFRGDIDQA